LVGTIYPAKYSPDMKVLFAGSLTS